MNIDKRINEIKKEIVELQMESARQDERVKEANKNIQKLRDELYPIVGDVDLTSTDELESKIKTLEIEINTALTSLEVDISNQKRSIGI